MRSCGIVFLLFFLISFAAGQDEDKVIRQKPLKEDSIYLPKVLGPDTSRFSKAGLPPDSLTTRRDTASVSGVDTVISYSSADSIVYSIPDRNMKLYSKGDIRYQRMQLQAERIDISWDKSIMTAYGIPDTADTTGKKQIGAPIMKDGGEEYHGKELGYNFQTKRGRIKVADTQMDQGYYHGERIKKVDQDILFVAGGRYTTCSLSDPDFYFASPKMKVMFQDKVVAEPVLFYISDVPVFWLPLAVFPNKAGRRSGIIAPAIAEDAAHGRMLRHIGYYFAISDYMDLGLRSDLYTKGSWAAYADYRYALRYNFSGSLSGNFRKIIEGEPSDPGRSKEESYHVNITHRQEIDPTTRFDVNFTFASNNSFRNTIDLSQGLDQSISSNATLSKSWEGTPNSVSLNISRTQNLIDGSNSETMPSISFNHSQSYPFRFGKGSLSDISGLSWYEMVGLGYGANLSNSRAKLSRSIDSIKINAGGADTIGTVKDFEISRNQVLTQDISLNIAPKLGHFTITPSLSYHDERSVSSNDVPTRNPADSSLGVENTQLTRRAGSVSTGVSASTKLYGIVQPGILGVMAVRHTVTPTLSFTYSKQVIGENLPPKQMLMSFNMGNIFEMKTMPAAEGEEGKKIQLLNIGGGISYNFSADSLNFSPISISYRTGIGNILDVGGGASFDLYKQDPQSYRRINKFLIAAGDGALARLTNLSLSLSTSLAGEKKKSPERVAPPQADTVTQRASMSRFYGVLREEEADFSIPWRLSLSMDYSENKVQPFTSRSSSVRGNLEFNLTENWKFSMSGGYDIFNKEVVVPQVNVTRDLHCWVMNFSWVPIGAWRHYMFEIRLKAPQLQDIKVTKQGSDRGIY